MHLIVPSLIWRLPLIFFSHLNYTFILEKKIMGMLIFAFNPFAPCSQHTIKNIQVNRLCTSGSLVIDVLWNCWNLKNRGFQIPRY